MLMSASIPCIFLFLPSETLTCVIALLTDLLSDKLIIRYLSLFNPVAADLLIYFFFLISQADKEFVWSLWKRLQVANPDLTQAVSLVVERWVGSIFFFKLQPERLNSWKFLYLTSAENSVWKSLKGRSRHLGHSARVTTESGADADLSRFIPGLAV